MKFSLAGCVFVVITHGILTAESAQALAFRCNSYVIDVGMHKMEVMQKCGLPAARDYRTERRRIGTRQMDQYAVRLPHPIPSSANGVRNSLEFERETEIQIEEWVYNFGPQRFMQLLRFEDGRLKQIQDLAAGQ